MGEHEACGQDGGNEFVIAAYVCMWKAEDRKSDRMQRAGVERRGSVGRSSCGAEGSGDRREARVARHADRIRSCRK